MKSCPKPPVSERSDSSILKRNLAQNEKPLNEANKHCYSSYENFLNRSQKLKLPSNWENEIENNITSLKFDDKIHVIPKFEIKVQNDLDFYILVFNWTVPKSNPLLELCNTTMKKVTLTVFINEISKLLCKGDNYKPNIIVSNPVPKIIDINFKNQNFYVQMIVNF